MGIIYQCAIRFLKVKDIAKVDTEPVVFHDGEVDNSKFNDFLVRAKENKLQVLKSVIVSPESKRGYEVVRIRVPEGTQVIAFGNDACDRLGGVCYYVDYHYQDESEDWTDDIWVDGERNRFMRIPKQTTSRLMTLDYTISSNPVCTYNELGYPDDPMWDDYFSMLDN